MLKLLEMLSKKCLHEESLIKATIKRSQQVITLASLKPSIKLNGLNMVIDPMVLFSRLLVLLQKVEDVGSFFAYELTPIPTALANAFDRQYQKTSIEPIASADTPIDSVDETDTSGDEQI